MDINIDTIITVVFVAVIILFNVFGTIFSRLIKRGQAGSDKTARTAPAEGLFQTLKSRVSNEIQVAMDQVAVPKTARPASPKAQKPKPPPAVPSREEDALIDDIRQELMREDVVAEAPEARKREGGLALADLSFSGRDLRRAVIWSEILAPPLALRE